MEIIIYTLIFIMGTVFGSFFTLAIYRIPLGENIVYKHSFCPNCNTKLKFKDLIPVLSYIFLQGKCAYCGQKIRIRYLLLEILSGIVFLLFALSLNIHIPNIQMLTVITFSFYILYFVTLFLIAGIDKENKNIQKSVLVFGTIVSIAYMTYVCITNSQAIYTYIIYFAILIMLWILDTISLKRKGEQNYLLRTLILLLYMLIFSNSLVLYFTIIFALIGVVLQMLYFRAKKQKISKLPIGFYLCISNIALIIIRNFFKIKIIHF